jgi:hypothetical protein
MSRLRSRLWTYRPQRRTSQFHLEDRRNPAGVCAANGGGDDLEAGLIPTRTKAGLKAAKVFALLCAAGLFYFCRRLPETKGKSLEEIAEYWRFNARLSI